MDDDTITSITSIAATITTTRTVINFLHFMSVVLLFTALSNVFSSRERPWSPSLRISNSLIEDFPVFLPVEEMGRKRGKRGGKEGNREVRKSFIKFRRGCSREGRWRRRILFKRKQLTGRSSNCFFVVTYFLRLIFNDRTINWLDKSSIKVSHRPLIKIEIKFLEFDRFWILSLR